MIVDFTFTFIIVALLAHIAWSDYQNRREKAKLINALLSKQANDMVNMTLADQTKVEPVKPDQMTSDISDLSDLSDEEYDRYIKSQLS